MFHHTSGGLGLAALVTVVSVGCDAARSPVAPSSESTAAEVVVTPLKADVPTSGVILVPITRGSLEISSRDDVALNVASNDPARFSWKGILFDGGNPFGINGAPGETVSIVGSWAGLSLAATTVTWGKTVFTRVGAMDATSGGRFRVYGAVTLPPHTGKRSDKTTGTFTISPPGEYSVFSSATDSGVLELRLTGGGRTTVSVEWQTDCCWEITHLTYRFE